MASQTMVFALNVANPFPGFFRATARDHLLHLPKVAVASYNLPEPTAQRRDTLMERFYSNGAGRAASMTAGGSGLVGTGEAGEAEPIRNTATP